MSAKLVTIVCPAFNEEKSIPVFYKRLVGGMAEVAKVCDFELIFTNNASTDGTIDAIKALRAGDSRVQVITLSRNFGYQKSLMAGLAHAGGDAVVIIDSDCEDPPEMIPRFVKTWLEGYDIVYGERVDRPEPMAISALRKIFYRFTHLIADTDFIVDMAEFSLFSRRVLREILKSKSTFPFIRHDIAFAGFRRIGIPYRREPRMFGKSNYNILGMTKFAVGGIMSASTFPLRFVVYVGAILLPLDFYWTVLHALGQTTRFDSALIFLNMSFVIFSLVAIGAYAARIYHDVVGRPLYILDRENTHLNPGRTSGDARKQQENA